MRIQQVAGCIAAFLFAALAFVAAVFFASFGLIVVRFDVVLAHTVVLGFPILLICWRKGWVNALSCAGAGFVVAAISGVVPNWPWQASMQIMRTNTWVRGVPYIIDGTPTAAAWLEFAAILALLGAFGALAGLIFWATLEWSGALAPVAKGTDRPQPASYWGPGTGRAMSLAIAAVLLTSGVFAVPIAVDRITQDRTCHNKFRDGRVSISPQVSMNLQITTEDWPKLERAVEDFARRHALSFRNSSGTRPVQTLHLSLCDERGLNISLGTGVTIGVYELQQGSGWERPTRDLVAALETLWPGKVQFRGPSGGYIPMPKELQ